MISKSKLQKSIQEIFNIYSKRNYTLAFTLESINEIFEIGNEVFMRQNPEEIERLSKRPKTKAPDIFDDEPFSFDRTFEIYSQLSDEFTEVSPSLIERIFELNSKLAWRAYRERYDAYIKEIYKKYPEDEYINYLATVVLYESKAYTEALSCVNKALSFNPSCAVYTHLKAKCLVQMGEFDTARTYLYQSLFLLELMQDNPPHKGPNKDIYPNYPVDFFTSIEQIRSDLRQLDRVDTMFKYQLLPLID
jgi:tetratricopeptide (TPR) repeat protein